MNGQNTKIGNNEFLVPANYTLINTAANSLDSSNAGLLYESFFGSRSIYSFTHFYANFRKWKRLDVGLHVSSDNQEDFSGLTSIGLPMTYRLMSNKDLSIFTSIRPNIWNYNLFGNQFFAGENLWGFNADASIYSYFKKAEFGFSVRNLIPRNISGTYAGVKQTPLFNLFLKYQLTESISFYNDLELENSSSEYLIGGKYTYIKRYSVYAQFNSKYGASIGADALIPIKRQQIKTGFYYGISNSASRKSQYALQLEILF